MTAREEMSVDGATIAWEDTGDPTAEPTLLIHAGVFGAWFEPLAPRLPGRVVRMLRAGYAGGPPPVGPVAFTTRAAHPPRCSTGWAAGRPRWWRTRRAASTPCSSPTTAPTWSAAWCWSSRR